MVPILPSIVVFLLAILSTLLLLVMLLYLRVTERTAPHISSYLKNQWNSDQHPLVSIIIAARNEEEKIARCISSLVNQTYKNFEIIIVDDNSADKTRSIAAEFESSDPRVHVISAGSKPNDWVGKSWPCHRGFESSKGELLLFVDADSNFKPQAVEYCVRYFESASIDMFSITPRVNLRGIWSKATLPLVSAGINLLYPVSKVNDKKSKRAYVFGTFILVRRSVYQSIGGHEKIRDRIVEDAAIAQLAKSNGYKLQVMVGDGLATTDWESDFRSVYHGMERIFSDSIRSYGLVSLLNAILIFFLGLYPILFILGFAIYSFFVSNIFLEASLNALILNAGLTASVLSVLLSISVNANELRLVMGRRDIGFAPLLYPLGFSLFMSAIVTSTLKVSRSKGLEWKGQRYKQMLVSN